MTHQCKIGDLLIRITHQNNDHLVDNIEKYETQEPSEYFLGSRFVKSLEECQEEIIKQDSFRKFYQNNQGEVIDIFHSSGKLKAKILMTEDYHNIEIWMIPKYFPNIIDSEYIYLSMFFPEIAIRAGYVILHASVVQMHDKGFLFCAPSMGGKTTHANHYLQLIEGATILNDDKALIKDGIVYGSPFSGQTKQNLNQSAPIEAVVFLSKATTNQFTLIEKQARLLPLIQHSLRPSTEDSWDVVISQLNQLVVQVPCYSGQVTKDPSSAEQFLSFLNS